MKKMKTFDDLMRDAKKAKELVNQKLTEKEAKLYADVLDETFNARQLLEANEEKIVSTLRENESLTLTLFEMNGLGDELGLLEHLPRGSVTIDQLTALSPYKTLVDFLRELSQNGYPFRTHYSVDRHGDPPADRLRVELVIKAPNEN